MEAPVVRHGRGLRRVVPCRQKTAGKIVATTNNKATTGVTAPCSDGGSSPVQCSDKTIAARRMQAPKARGIQFFCVGPERR